MNSLFFIQTKFYSHIDFNLKLQYLFRNFWFKKQIEMCDESTDHVVLKEQRQNRIEDFDEDDDDIRLPADTLAILNEFLRERSDNQTENTSNGKTEIKIEEDWVRQMKSLTSFVQII